MIKNVANAVRRRSDSGLHVVCVFLKANRQETVENIPFGGSRRFSVNTQTNAVVTISSSGQQWVVFVRSVCWKCVSAQIYTEIELVC